MCPTSSPPNAQGGKANKDVGGINSVVSRVFDDIERNIDTKTDDREDNHEIARHLSEPQE